MVEISNPFLRDFLKSTHRINTQDQHQTNEHNHIPEASETRYRKQEDSFYFDNLENAATKQLDWWLIYFLGGGDGDSALPCIL